MSRPMWRTEYISLMNQWISSIEMSDYVSLRRQRPVCQFSWCPQRDMSPLWPVIKLQGNATSDRQTVTSDGGGKSPAWPLITLLLRTFVIRLSHIWNSRTATQPPENCGFGSVRLRLKTSGFRFWFENHHSTNHSDYLLHCSASAISSNFDLELSQFNTLGVITE